MPFFDPTIWSRQRKQLPLVPQCGACRLYKDCSSPFMEVSGRGRRRILLVGEAPGKNEDEKGRPLVGNAGIEQSRLLHKVGVEMRSDCWITNALVCRPHTHDGENRRPTGEEIQHCRPNLAKVIRELQPDVIIPIGEVAMSAVAPLAGWERAVHSIRVWAGWRIPSIRLNAWICPTYHPAFLLRDQSPALELHMLRHLKAAAEIKGKPWGVSPDWESRVNVIMNHKKAASTIKSLVSPGVPIAFDYETDRLKPDHPDSKILCCSLSDGQVSIAFPWLGDAIWAMDAVLRDRKVPKIGANCRFEERWTRRIMGHGVSGWLNGGWDTVLGAHWLDCRTGEDRQGVRKEGICGLKFQAFVRLGVEDYSSHLEEYMGGTDSNSRNRLHEVDPTVLLKYCAMDSLYEHMVCRKQQEEGGQAC